MSCYTLFCSDPKPFRSQHSTLLFFPHFYFPPDALLVAVQPTGEAATAEMVHTDNRPGEEEGDPGHDDISVGPSTTFLQLPPVERPQDRLQEVVTQDIAVFFHCVIITG